MMSKQRSHPIKIVRYNRNCHMSYEFLPRSCNRESSITCRCRILLSFYYPNNHFGIQTYKGNQMGPNITHKQFAYLNLVLDEVNHLYLSLSK